MRRASIFITCILLSLTFSPVAFAQIPSGDQIEKINEKVDELKNKVASKVAELNLVEKRGVVGIVEKSEDNQITITDIRDKTRIIDIDEITNFSSEENDAFEFSDIKKGSQISVLGLYNKDSQRLLARFVNEISIPLFINGVISEKNEEDFTITVLDGEKNKYVIDIERVTKSFNYIDGDLEQGGFSKLAIGENVIVSGFENPKEKNRITGERVVSFPGLPMNPNVRIEVSVTGQLSPTPTPSDDL